MKKKGLYGICVLFLLLLTPVISYADNTPGKTQADVTFTQGPKKKDEPNSKKENLFEKVLPDPKGVLPNTGEHQRFYLMFIGATLILLSCLIVRRKRKIESRKNK